MKLDLSNLDRHIQSSLNGIQLLYSHHHFDQARYCAYILIDQLAWLVSGSEQRVNVYFKEWVCKYFIPYYPEITPEELWASRNALLHNGSSISRQIENGTVARQLFYIDKLNSTEDVSHKFDLSSGKFFPVNTVKFIQVALFRAIEDFRRELSNGGDFDIVDVEKKLGKLLIPVQPEI